MLRALLLAGSLVANGALAQEYDVVPGESDDIHAAIDRAVQHMSFITRPIARHRLRVNNPLPQHLQLDVAPDTIVVHLGDALPAVLPRDGTSVRWTDLDGDKCHASLTMVGDTLIERVIAPGGESETRYVRLDDGQRVREEVRITSSHLPEPVVYTVMFARHTPPYHS
jgi:hypothetical protein